MSATDPTSSGSPPSDGPVSPRQSLRFEALSVTREGRVALDGVSLVLEERRVGIVGLNGSGKSTLLKTVIGLVTPTAGRVTVDGLDPVRDARAVRATTGLLFQNPDNQIVFPIVADDLAFGLKNHGWGKAETRERATAALARLGIEALATRRIHELSGGEKQLVALAGLLAVEPKTLLFDEPTSQLDLSNRNRLARLLRALPEQVIVVAHDLELLAEFERVIVLEAGRVAFDGAADAAIAFHRERAA